MRLPVPSAQRVPLGLGEVAPVLEQLIQGVPHASLDPRTVPPLTLPHVVPVLPPVSQAAPINPRHVPSRRTGFVQHVPCVPLVQGEVRPVLP